MLFLLQMTLNGAGILSKNDGYPLTGIKRPRGSVNHFPSSSAEVKLGWGYTSTGPIRLHGTDWGNFTQYMSPVNQTLLFSFLYKNANFAYLGYEQSRPGQAIIHRRSRLANLEVFRGFIKPLQTDISRMTA
jgi:hypothetical protein